MNNTRNDEQAGACEPPKPGCDADPRRSTPLHRGLRGSKNVRDLFLRYPNVIAYVAGHTHAQPGRPLPQGRTGFWQINTASHIDWPQQSRLIEVMDNRDGTLSLFGTILDHAAPIATPAPGTAAAALHRRAARQPRPRAGLERPAETTTEHLGRRERPQRGAGAARPARVASAAPPRPRAPRARPVARCRSSARSDARGRAGRAATRRAASRPRSRRRRGSTPSSRAPLRSTCMR